MEIVKANCKKPKSVSCICFKTVQFSAVTSAMNSSALSNSVRSLTNLEFIENAEIKAWLKLTTYTRIITSNSLYPISQNPSFCFLRVFFPRLRALGVVSEGLLT